MHGWTHYSKMKQTMKQNHISNRRVALICVLCLYVWLPAQSIKELYIFHTNDTHSCIEPIGAHNPDTAQANKAGFVRRATFLKEMRKQHPDMLLFDSGDFSQGSPYYNIFKGDVEVSMMNEMGYDAGTIGNHEFDFGLDNMARLFRMAKFSIVCANYGVEGTVLEGLVKPYVILHRDGLKIGVFGLSPKLEGLVQQKNYEGLVYKDPIRCANKVAALLKEQKHCDVVICLSHLGWKGRESDEVLISATKNIDVVLGGHSHSYFETPIYYKNLDGVDVPLQQMGKNGRFVGEIVLEFQKD